MKTKTIILCTITLGLFCCFGLSQPQGHAEPAVKSEYGIIFNGGYTSIKQKWQGPLHNKLLFPWFTAHISAINQKEYEKLIKEQNQNGVKFIGYYYSATTSYPVGDIRRFPERAIPPESIDNSLILHDHKGNPVGWPNQKDRYFLDAGAKQVQDVILTRAIRNAKQLGPNVLFLDNWTYKYWCRGT